MPLFADEWVLLVLVGLITGLSKLSVGGMGMIILPLLMLVVPGPQALGVLIPMFIVTDLLAVGVYRRNISWPVLARFIPVQVVGLLIGCWLIADLSTEGYSWLIAGAILVLLSFSLWLDHHDAEFMRKPMAANIVGGLAGVFGMAANSAGPFVSLFMLEQRLSKASYISTRACSFLLINTAKVPLLLMLGYLDWDNAALGMQMLPFVAVGAGMGFWLLRHLALSHFKWLIRGIACIAAVRLLFTAF